MHSILKDPCLQFKAMTCVAAGNTELKGTSATGSSSSWGKWKGMAGEQHTASHLHICQLTAGN